jgi:hypothetical protein
MVRIMCSPGRAAAIRALRRLSSCRSRDSLLRSRRSRDYFTRNEVRQNGRAIGEKRRMRRFMFLAPIAAALLGAPLAAAAQNCLRPVDQAAFDVASLKSQLMVTALTCNMRDGYNTFVLRFRTDLMAQERALQSYFVRSFGASGQQQHDDYITQLANTQSEAGIHDGSMYCTRNAGLLQEVLSLPNGVTLTAYAASKSFMQPVALQSCGVPQQGPLVAQTRNGWR